MVLWRISNYSTLDGMGGLKISGRWHRRGRPIVYLSQNPSSALLEILVHLEIRMNDLPSRYKLLEIYVPDEIRIEKAEFASLPGNWKEDLAATQSIGDQWLTRSSSALLEVPSALVPHTSNFLFNPHHKDAAKIIVASIAEHPIDMRLLL